MRRHLDQDIPDFLLDSPYLPVYDEKIHRPHTPPKKLTLRQFLSSRKTRSRTILALKIAALLTILIILRNAATKRWYSGPRCLFTEPITPPTSYPNNKDINWSKYAYVQYVTNTEYLCNSIMIFESLHRLGTRADLLMLYPKDYSLSSQTTEGRLLRKARDEYGAKLVPIVVQRNNAAYRVWADSYTKLLAFNQTQYDRVLVLDSDATILQPMDELFFTPSNPATMPRAYWLSKPLLTSHIMLLEPSAHEFSRVQKAIWKAGRETYDMEIINDLYRGSCAVLPHQKYALLTGEFRRTEHKQYLAGSGEDWDPEKVRREAKYVHFSDHPLEKPWVESEDWKWEEAIPKCVEPAVGFEECRARDIWVELYDDFLERRESVCGIGI